MKRKHNSSDGLLQLSILNFVVPVKRHRSLPPIREDRQDDNAPHDRGDIDGANPYEDIDLAEGISDDEIINEPQDPVVSDAFAQKWVTRLISATQEPPRDITPFLRPGVTLPIIKDNQQVFKSTITTMLQRAKDFAEIQDLEDIQGKGFQGRAMTVGFVKLFRRLEISDMIKPLIDSMYPEVVSLLGRKSLQASDLLDLPRVDDNFRLWGVYLDIVTDESGEVQGLYIGSSVAYRTYIGITGRIRWHKRRALQPFDTIPKHEQSKHYRLITQNGMTSHFRSLALFKIQPSNIAPTVISESLLMCFLSTICGAFSEQKSFVELLREDLPGIHDFSELSLNRGLPLAAGYPHMPTASQLHKIWLKENKLEDICMNCERPAPADDSTWGGCFAGRRCRACISWRNDHGGSEKPPGSFVSQGDHELWLSMEGNDDVCQNPLCGEPRPPGEKSRFMGFGPLARCGGCYEYRRTHDGKENPKPRRGRTFANHQNWLDQGHADVYGKCRTPRPNPGYVEGWIGWLEAARCPACRKAGKVTEAEDRDWVAEHGDSCALCGVGTNFTPMIYGRAENRRCLSCNRFRRKYYRDKNEEDLKYGSRNLHEEWVAAGNPDVCGRCGNPRRKGKFFSYRENQRCNTCYIKERKEKKREMKREMKEPGKALFRLPKKGVDWRADGEYWSAKEDDSSSDDDSCEEEEEGSGDDGDEYSSDDEERDYD